MQKLVFFLSLMLAVSFSADHFFYNSVNDLTSAAVNYQLQNIRLEDRILTVEITITNLSNSPIIIDPMSWRLLDTGTKSPAEEVAKQTLFPGSVGQYRVSYQFKTVEELSLIITENIIFEFKYYPVDQQSCRKYYPESMVIVQQNDVFFRDRHDKKYLLLVNNDHSRLISEAYLVVPTKNIALQRLDFKHFVTELKEQASHLLIYYRNSDQRLVNLRDLPQYFPDDIKIEYNLQNRSFNIKCTSDRNFIRVTAVVSGKYYPLAKHDNTYQVAIPLKDHPIIDKFKLYFRQKDNLYTRSVILDESDRNSL